MYRHSLFFSKKGKAFFEVIILAAKYKVKARLIKAQSKRHAGVLLLVYILFAMLFFTVPFFLQFFFCGEVWMLTLKAVFFFLLSVLLPVFFSAFRLGTLRFFQREARCKNERLSKAFYYFSLKKVLRQTAFSFALFSVKALIFALCFLPVAVLSMLFLKLLESGGFVDSATVLVFGLISLSIVCAYFYFRAVRLLFLSKYFFVRDDGFKIKECLKRSVEIMAGNTGKLFRLKLGFLHWFLSCVFFFPTFYVWSFYNQTLAVFSEELIKESTAT